ncbi:MAG TPA: hypothetical protein VHC47_05125 [Mucilaginibacter sp.]|nr:hypothetical protein [Mucilaginibacter sp.]
MTTDNDTRFFFAVKHIIRPFATKLIYDIRYNNADYFIMKTPSANDCEQLDANPGIEKNAFKRICDVITAIEREYNTTPPLELINIDIFNMLARDTN